MSKGRIEFRAERKMFGRGIDLYVGEFDRLGAMVSVAAPVVVAAHEDGAFVEPTISLRNDAAQLLMDELWRCGLRPTEGSGSAGSLAATERHLEDMKKVAFGLLKKEGIDV